MSCGVVPTCGLDPTLLWLWCRLAVAALILPLAWELSYATDVALKKKKKKKKKKGNFESDLEDLPPRYSEKELNTQQMVNHHKDQKNCPLFKRL